MGHVLFPAMPAMGHACQASEIFRRMRAQGHAPALEKLGVRRGGSPSGNWFPEDGIKNIWGMGPANLSLNRIGWILALSLELCVYVM